MERDHIPAREATCFAMMNTGAIIQATLVMAAVCPASWIYEGSPVFCQAQFALHWPQPNPESALNALTLSPALVRIFKK